MIRQILKAIGNGIDNMGRAAQGESTKDYSNPADFIKGTGKDTGNGEANSSAAALSSSEDFTGGSSAGSQSSGGNMSLGDAKKAGEAFKTAKDAKGFASAARGVASMLSDERLKVIFENDDRVADLARINSYDFTYKPEAQRKFGVDGDEHTGVMAQEIEVNPSFKGCVGELDDGTKVLNIKELTASNTAGLGDVARAVMDIEARLQKLESTIGDR